MQVASLTATLEANVASFMANLRGADRQAEDTRNKLVELVVASRTASAALDGVKLDPAQTAATKAYAAEMKKAVDHLTVSAEAAGREIHDMNLQKSQVMKFISGAEAMKEELRDIRKDAMAATAALDGLEIREDVAGRRGTSGQFLPGRTFVGPSPVPSSYVRGVTPTDRELLDRWEAVARRMPLALPEHAGGGIPMGKASGDNFGESFVRAIEAHYPPVSQYATPEATRPMTKEDWLSLFATPEAGRRLVPVGGYLPTDPGYLNMDAKWRQGMVAIGALSNEANALLRASEAEINRARTPDITELLLPGESSKSIGQAKRFLRSKGIPTTGEFTSVFGGISGAKKRGEDAADALGIAETLGFTEKTAHWRRFGFGGGGRGIFGFGLPVPPHARFGRPLALAGFGLDRMIASTLGILGSFGGGILGGGILGAGALGTMAVGAGTNLAGMGQAAGDIHTVTGDLNKLQTAIQQYGKNSTQAADAQLQLNTDLKGFSPVARQAVLAASQTAQGFKAMFDKVTGGAEKIGAEIINQAMQVGEKFLPIIGKFSQQNMGILQRGLQPFFGFLTRGGNAQNVIKDVNALNQAIKDHGVHSIQAIQANEKLYQANKRTGGLAYFTDLEKVFQKHFPTAIHAGEQGFELLMKTIDLAAQHLGHFLGTMNSFLTRMNNQDFGKWAVGVEHLISLFHSWLGMFVAFGKVVVSVFKQSLGLGQAFANEMAKLFTQINKYLNQDGTKNILHQLFSVHLVQAIKQIGGLISSLMPILENFASAWMQIEIEFVRAFNSITLVIKGVINWINKIPGADKAIGWVTAIGTIVVVNRLLMGSILPILRSIPLIGGMFGKASSEASTAVTKVTTAVDAAAATMVTAVDRVSLAVANLGRQFLGLGPLAAEGAAEADAAMATTTAEAGLLSRTGTRALSMVGLGGLRGGGIKSVLGKAGLYAIGGVVAGQIIQSIVPGKTGSVLGNIAKGAGIGAGIGMFVGMPEVGAAIGGVTGALISLVHTAPSAGKALEMLGKNYRALGSDARNAKLGIVQTRGNLAQDRQLRSEAQQQVNVARSHLRAAHGAQARAKATQNLQIALGNLAGINSKIIQEEKTLSDLMQRHHRDAQNQKNDQKQYVETFEKLATAAKHFDNISYRTLSGAAKQTAIAKAQTQGFMQALNQLSSSSDPKLRAMAQELAKIVAKINGVPNHKTFTLIVRAVLKGNAALLLDPLSAEHVLSDKLMKKYYAQHSGGSDPHGTTIHLNLPRSIQEALLMAQAGHGSMLKAEKAAYDYYQKQLSQPGLTRKQKDALLRAEAQYFQQGFGTPKGYQHGGHYPGTSPGSTPTGYLDKQQAETSRARIEIAHGQYAAALKLLRSEDQQLHAMLKMAKTQAERTAILSQLATVAGLIKSTKTQQTGISANNYQIPMALQVAMAKADALAALNPNLQGPTAQQYQLAVQAKKAAMKAINSHHLTMQQLIDAWNVVGQANSVIAQRLGVMAYTYHKQSTDAVTDAVKGLSRTQELQLRELMAQRDAHRGYAPNQSAVGGGGSTAASPHHRRRHHHHHNQDGGSGGGGRPNMVDSSRQGPSTIHIDTVEIHGVQNVRELAAEINKLARQKHQRAGGRR